MLKGDYQSGDRVKFRRNDGSVYEGWIMWFYPDGTVQISDNKQMTCQNFVIKYDDILSLSPLT